MKTFTVPALEQVDGASQTILTGVQKKLGKIPNLYATIGYSAPALKAMLDFEATLGGSNLFTAKEREAINLVVSQVNLCDYCLAAHTALAQMRGFSIAETIAIRKGDIADSRLNTIIRLAQSIAENKGKGEQSRIEAFFEAGFTEAAFIELIGLITARTFTNYVFASTGIPVDFPAAPALQ
ncbi:putative peroxidase-related enzyme [Filimonas zeae]|uniref:Alkyl hydroperoxide reductase AhpD n=1 Tax=Filimonas zeae TaxID=1737353 RepID=A0A917MUG3_9BACT|nr:carboxymuconolactone decarboxylase family protein [Filimonas zeae]MDR6337977.1 putative peroxidase-related enzyme [Filimonas zeae]GGH61121.1 alkyl hydroperoxide reductase AhpD [Filimonas zeae]